MRTKSFYSKELVKLLKRQKIAAIDELKAIFGTDLSNPGLSEIEGPVLARVFFLST